jgi:tetratricopeptide (TPR) repeat protein
MTPVTRMRVIVGLAAVAAAAVVAGVVSATRQDPAQPTALCKEAPKPVIVPGVASPHVAAVRHAFARGPKHAARLLEPIAAVSPRDVVVAFNYGTALLCAGYVTDATAAYRQAKKAGPDTPYRVQADVLIHPQFFTKGGYPILQYYGTDPLLLAGQLQQRQYHQVSAERLYARAARLHPGSADAQVAAAVGRFDMDDLSASFSRLGPLVRRFPKSQTVRFHLGLLLAWTAQRDLAVKEFRAARALDPSSRLGRDADTFLRGLVTGGTKGAKR